MVIKKRDGKIRVHETFISPLLHDRWTDGQSNLWML